ncbi:MAG: hypothetical protein U9R75_02535 [Candidatus Thermoplasmatota archaeon]|nr:hypothetical protein [Candidatus Thermoplasmatota archaeon]
MIKNKARQRSFDHVVENLDHIRRELGLNTSSMVYHLPVLTSKELSKVVSDDPYRILYSTGFKTPDRICHIVSTVRAIVIRVDGERMLFFISNKTG